MAVVGSTVKDLEVKDKLVYDPVGPLLGNSPKEINLTS